MKTLRSILFILTGLSLIAVWSGCKKGPQDPFFSLYSRLQRVCGDWKVSEFKVNYVDSIRRRIDSVYDGTGVGCGPQTYKQIDTYNYTWSFDKHGGFQDKLILFHDTIIDIKNNTLLCKDYFSHDSIITVKVQSWNFTSNVGDFKNKEQMYIYDAETKLATIYTIIELREKEMKLETSTINPDSNTVHLKQYTMTKL